MGDFFFRVVGVDFCRIDQPGVRGFGHAHLVTGGGLGGPTPAKNPDFSGAVVLTQGRFQLGVEGVVTAVSGESRASAQPLCGWCNSPR
jgi:hypothetical protein